MLRLHETYDHWSVAVLTVTVHFIYSHFWFIFFYKLVAFCTEFNLFTPFFLFPFMIMDLPYIWDYFDLFIEKCLQKCYIFTPKIDNGRLLNLCFIQCCYVSVNFKPDNPLTISEFQAWQFPGKPPGNVFERANSLPPGTKKVDPWGRKMVLRPHPWGNYFRKTSQTTQNISETSTELLIFI